MDLRRLRAGEWITALAGVLLLASLFSPWYGTPDASGWEALAVNDVVLALVAAGAIALFIVTASQGVPVLPIVFDALVALAALVGLVLVVVRVAALPDGADSREWGLWLALLAVIGVNVGAWIAMRDERLSKPGRPTDLSGRPIAAPPEIETLPAPGARGASSP
jgi:peptidoglycan/LPS O-acetylase OafA/YrhL